MDHSIIITRRVTSAFINAIPPQIQHFDGYLYAIVKRAKDKDIPDHKYGQDVRIDPCEFDWKSKTITCIIPYNINFGIKHITDIDPMFFESIEASFIALMHGCIP